MATKKIAAASVAAPEPTPEPKPLDRAAVMAKFRADLESQMEKALDEFNAEKIVKEIVADAKKQQQELVMRVIGMDNRFGRWEVDHCNGRMSNITEFVDATCGPMLKEALAELMKEEIAALKVKTMPKLKKAIAAELDNRWNKSIDEAARDVVRHLADKCAQDFKAGVVGELE